MRVIIDISDTEYCTIKDMNLTLHTAMLKGSVRDWENANTILNLLESVKSGTVLPKGHGDLIDRSELIKVLETEIMYTEDTKRRATLNYVFCVLVGSVPTVIEGE